jgi:hypothetical protein
MLRRALPSGARTQKGDMLTSGGPEDLSVLSVPDPTSERTT